MVGRQLPLLAAALVIHFFATSTWAASVAVKAAETVSNGKSLTHSHAASSVQRVHVSEMQQAMSGAQLRGLRTKAQSSHGRRANVFRAAASSAVRSTLTAKEKQAPAPVFIVKMGLANVTEPTPYPPPPPVLHPWKEMQPLDTALGNYLISGLIAQPTVTPPPSQSSLDLAFACPALLTWPTEVSVSAPDPCGSTVSGNWTEKKEGGPLLINWKTSCIDTTSPGVTPPSTSPVTTYSMPNGDLFGTSQVVQTPWADSIELRDCGGATVFTVTEKIYKQTGKPDESACSKYGSCDGVLYFQYFVADAQGKTVALSPYTTIFQDSFDLTDSAGGLIVTISRNGWEPNDRQPDCSLNPKMRQWDLKYANSPPGIWAAATGQWPIAAMMTMMAARDSQRQPDGRVLWSNCNVLKTTGWVLLGVSIVFCFVCIPMAIYLICSASISKFVKDVETKLYPKRMGKPAQYD